MTLSEKAITAALSGNWQEAISLNEEILREEPQHIDALNRLAYAYAKCGNYEKACSLYEKVLQMDPYNPLAQKNLHKFKSNGQKTGHSFENISTHKISPSLFLTDSNKTKIVKLLNVASRSILQELSTGEELSARPKRFELHLYSNLQYVGTLPDDIGHPILKHQKNGQPLTCAFFVKDVSDHEVSIFIRY